jgi:hypothetical protein
VRARHIVAALDDLDEVKSIMRNVYHVKQKQFPFGVCMRFVPWIAFNNTKRIQQVMDMRLQQDAFLNTVNHMASWECHGIDKTRGLISSLRELILNLKSNQFPDSALFISVDRAWNSPGVHGFAFMPRMEAEARHAVTTLFPLLKHHHGADIELYFTESAKRRSDGCSWDSELQKITTKDKVCFETLHEALDEDNDWFGFLAPTETHNSLVNLTPFSALTQSGLKVQNMFYGDEKDSVGTIRTGASAPSPTGDIVVNLGLHPRTHTPQDSISASGSTLDTRVSVIEDNLHRLADTLTIMTTAVTSFQEEVRTNFDSIRRFTGNAPPSLIGSPMQGTDPSE